MSARPLFRDRRGMTLTELLVALVLTGLVLGPAFALLRQQQLAYALGVGRLELTQSHRFAMSTLDKDLRTAGSGIPLPNVQPTIVYAGTDVFAFNADYASRDPADLFAVYVDSSATPEMTDALTSSRRYVLPQTSFSYPDTSYRAGAGNSPAETIIFYFQPDATTARGDDYVLMRRVNDQTPEVVARNLLKTGTTPFFQYLELVTPASGPTEVDTVPASVMPLAHTKKIHGIPAMGDTLPYSRIDGIKAVVVNFTATNGMTGNRQQIRAVSRVIRLPNSGMAELQTCGELPGGVTALTDSLVGPAGARQVKLFWSPSVDENSGEQDVLRYIVWRRVSGTSDFGDPIGSVSGGSAKYTYTDGTAVAGTTYEYGVAAQDCTPALSATSVSPAITP